MFESLALYVMKQ